MKVELEDDEKRQKRVDYHRQWREENTFARRDYMREYMREYRRSKGNENAKRAYRMYSKRQTILRRVQDLNDALDDACW